MKVGDKVILKQVNPGDDIYIFSWDEYHLLKDRVLTIASYKYFEASQRASVVFHYPDDIIDKALSDGCSFYYYDDVILKKIEVVSTEII